MESRYSRRFFIGGALGMGALAGCRVFAKAGAAAATGARLKLGVLSDIHLKEPGDETTFIKALEYYRDHGAEAVLIAGDFADGGRVYQAKMLADAWFRIFPNDRAPDGRKVERLFIYGNHCVTGWTWGKPYDGRPEAARREAIGFEDNRARIWEECFHEEFRPIWMKTVKGIPVIGAHWEERGGGNQIEEYLKTHGKEIDPALPFIYTQHDHPKDTCFGRWAWGHDDGRATRALSPFPNAIAFSGHSHYTLVDERSVWQGAFTSINTASLKYASTDYAMRENMSGNRYGYQGEGRRHCMPTLDTNDGREGMLVSVFDDHLAIERREFVYDRSLGDDWVVPLAASEPRPFSYAVRAAKRSAPVFAAGAEVAVKVTPPKDERDFTHIELSFPSAAEVDRCRVSEYEITAVLVEDDFELVQVQRRMLAPDFYLPRGKLADKVAFTFAASDLQVKGNFRFEVRALECFGKKGDKITSPLVNFT